MWSIISLYRLVLLITCAIAIKACKDQGPVFKPRFRVGKDSVYGRIQNIVKTGNIWMEGYKTPVDDTFDISLNIQLINPQRLPPDSQSVADIHKRVASNVKGLLNDESQFRKYHIIILKRDTVKTPFGIQKTEVPLYPPHIFQVSDL